MHNMRALLFFVLSGLAWGQYSPPGGGGATPTTVQGTTNQVTSTAIPGGVKLSLPNPVTIPVVLNVPNGAANFGAPGVDGILHFYDLVGADTTLASPDAANGTLNIGGVPIPLNATAVVGLFSTCSGTQYLGADGACHNAGASPTTNQNIRTIGAVFGDFSSGASAISGAQIACVPVYFAGTIGAVELIATPSGSVTVDVKTVAHGSFTGPSSTSSITASDIPALSSATTFSDTTLTGWSKTVAAGTDVCFYLTSPTTVAGVAIAVKVAAQ